MKKKLLVVFVVFSLLAMVTILSGCSLVNIDWAWNDININIDAGNKAVSCLG